MYLVTGGTGFIGRNLITCLMEREGTIYVLVRSASKAKIDDLRERVGDEDGRIVPIKGDLLKSKLGISKKDLAALEGKVKHVFHLAAIYDIENEND
ncbi:MAG: SDR family oxidoreductase, partial [Pseudomonadota bacterium]